MPGWLLVFDNADPVADIRPWLPTVPLPAGVPGHVIVTTRRGGFTALGPVMELDVVDLPTAVRLLRARVPGLDRETSEHIAEELGRLPLTLEQAAAYLDRTQMPGEEYLDLLRSRAADLYARGHVSSRTDTIATLWDISLERISAESPAAAQLLGVCAYLAPEPIPLDLFTSHADLLPEPLTSVAAPGARRRPGTWPQRGHDLVVLDADGGGVGLLKDRAHQGGRPRLRGLGHLGGQVPA